MRLFNHVGKSGDYQETSEASLSKSFQETLVHLNGTSMSCQMVMQVVATFEEFEALRTLVLADALVVSLNVGLETVGTAEHFPTAWQGTNPMHCPLCIWNQPKHWTKWTMSGTCPVVSPTLPCIYTLPLVRLYSLRLFTH